jgi:hypothetical protein
MSIAILPMAAEYKWNAATVGLVQSSFFWGYLLTQVKRLPISLLGFQPPSVYKERGQSTDNPHAFVYFRYASRCS